MKFNAHRVIGLAALSLLVGAGGPAASADPPLRFAPERDYGPFVFVDTAGNAAGLSVDMLTLLMRHSGLQLNTLPAAPLKDQLQLLRDGKADLVSSLRPTPERGVYLAFTTPYVRVPAIVVGRVNAAQGGPPRDTSAGAVMAALADKAVAVGEGYGVEAFVRARFPAVSWRAVPDDVQALRGVAEGRYEAAVVDAASAAFVKQRHGLRGLQRLGSVGFEYALSFAVPKARSDLLDRLNGAIREIPRADSQAVYDRWMKPIEDDDFFRSDRSWVFVVLAVVALVIAGVGVLALGARWRAASKGPE